jgi:hypothetical protein
MTNNQNRPFSLPDVSGIDMNKLGYGQNRTKNSDPEYILNNTKGRDIGPRLFFNTGVFWLGGFTAGGLYGCADGWRNAPSTIFKIRVNSVLNGVSRSGSLLANSLAGVGKFNAKYNVFC